MSENMTTKTKKTQPIHLPVHAHSVAKAYADESGMTIGDAAAALIDYAMRRRAALAKDAAKRKAQK